MRMSKNKKKSRKRRSWRSGLKAGCVALGMATAWGGQADAGVMSLVSITPEVDLTHAFVYYGNNVTSGMIKSLGDLPGGQTTTVSQTGFIVDFPQHYDETNGHRPTYAVIALYDEGGSPGVAISFPNDDPIAMNRSWDDIFRYSYYPGAGYDEEEVVNSLLQSENEDPSGGPLDWFLCFAMSDSTATGDHCATEYGQQATLICFSNATFGGTVTVDVVPIPEPAAWVLVIGMAGALLWWRRDLLGG
ncbi:MAG: hypothetical protein JW809_12515 [Pirellulales bacterium]|nr:hypothetical protein [Pirellulales bacterium]